MTWRRKSKWHLECDRSGMTISKIIIDGQPGYTLWSSKKPKEILKVSRNPEILKRYAAEYGTETNTQQRHSDTESDQSADDTETAGADAAAD